MKSRNMGSDWLKLLKSAKSRGWEEIRISSNHHLILLWPITGKKVTVSGSKDPGAIKQAQRQMAKIEQGF
jgi:hypothetical protein